MERDDDRENTHTTGRMDVKLSAERMDDGIVKYVRTVRVHYHLIAAAGHGVKVARFGPLAVRYAYLTTDDDSKRERLLPRRGREPERGLVSNMQQLPTESA